jgi:hypothetical protein
MAKTKQDKTPKIILGRRARLVVLPLFFVIGGGVIFLTILSIILMPSDESKPQYGVGADGFYAYVEDDSDLGVRSVVSKDQVVAALGNKAKSVDNGQTEKVFNFNGDRSQSLTFPFVRADGAAATLYVDMKLYKNMQSLDKDNVYVGTMKAGQVQGHPAYYKLAQTISNNREYHMMVINGLRAYRFVVSQPVANITINEVGAMGSLQRLAAEAKL